MAIPFTMKRKNGSGYDVLYPATKQELVAGCQKKIWIASKTLTSAGWVATEDGYSTQNVTIAGGTATTQVDVQGNYAVFRQMLDDGTTNIYIVNNGGTFTAYAVGETPTADLAVQVTCSDVTPPPVMAVKGELLTMDLDGNGNKTYRVLAINGNVAKLLGMSDISTSQKYNATSKTGTFTNGSTGQLYAGSDLDTYLNTTWYNTLTSTVKAAIVPESRTQYMYKYYDKPNTPNTPTYTYQYQYNWSNSDYENANLTDSILIGNRNIFALDLKDIYDYFGKVCITSNELMELWTNQTSKVSSKYWWLSSASAGGPGDVWFVEGGRGDLTRNGVGLANAVRPAFTIDLSKISYTRE